MIVDKVYVANFKDQPPTYAWRCGPSPWLDFKYDHVERWRRTAAGPYCPRYHASPRLTFILIERYTYIGILNFM